MTASTTVARAIRVLEANWNGSHTLPATGLYPHQWSWDSGFIAMGLRHVSPRRAGQELDSLLAGQWADGRIPQIIFDPHRDQEYSPGAAFWRSELLDASPDDVLTAGLVQPPNHAWAVWKIHVADPAESSRRWFLQRAYPRLIAWHEYLLTRRDRGRNGLACVVHPWESGTDNSPLWDDVLRTVPTEARTPIERPDLLHADATERPTERDYGRYFWLAERYRDHSCDDADPEYPFLMEDPGFNALLAVSELALERIAGELGLDGTPHAERARRIVDALDTLYEPAIGCYTARNVRDGSLATPATVNGLLPLLLPDAPHTPELLHTLLGPRFLGSGAALVPSYDATADDIDPQLYWRGPAWFNMNWMMIIALSNLGYTEVAGRLATTAAELARGNNFPEYVNPWTATAHGTRNFSWTAALCLDLASGTDQPLL
ncbi:hypothetical protein [Kribbella sp. NPDC048928]|uniref:MGH1-like glycoside hydrolase domain-containing protein n=1 Tax=Kribbella sp. NPDC048928 TaxID=3364111 RepID=UPI00371C9F28